MNAIARIHGAGIRGAVSDEELGVRVDLAACYRLMAHFGLTDLIYNHITARVPGPEHHLLINSYGMVYDEVTASSVQKIDLNGNVILAPYSRLDSRWKFQIRTLTTVTVPVEAPLSTARPLPGLSQAPQPEEQLR